MPWEADNRALYNNELKSDADLVEIVDILQHDLTKAKKIVLRILRGRKKYKEGLKALQIQIMDFSMRRDEMVHTQIFSLLNKALKKGSVFNDFKKDVIRLFASDNLNLSVETLETIYGAYLGAAYGIERYKGMMEVCVTRPFWRYIAVEDPSTCPTHALLDGKIIPFNNIFWNTHYPPNGWNCRCRVSSLSEREIKRDGLIVESNSCLQNMKIEPDIGWSFNVGRSGIIVIEQMIKKLITEDLRQEGE